MKKVAGHLLRFHLLLLLPRIGYSQKAFFSLQQLVDSADKHLPLLLQKRALVQSAEAGVTEARHAFLPQLNIAEEVSVGSANDLAGPYLPLPGITHGVSGSINPTSNYQAVTGNFASVYAQYELVNFGLKGARTASARSFADWTRADLEKQRYLVTLEVAGLYFAIQRLTAELAVDSEDIRRHQTMYTISRALSGSGVTPGVDSSLASAALSRSRITFIQTSGTLRNQQQQLSWLCGITSPIAFDTTPPRPIPELDNPAAANPLEDYFRKQQLQYQADQRLASKSYLPKIIVGAGGWARGSALQYNNQYQSVGEGLGYQRLNYLAGLGVTYDLFNGVRRKDRMTVLGHQAEAAGYALQQEQEALHTQRLQSEESIRTASASLAELPAQLKAASNAYDQKLAQYRAGIITLVDLTTASFELLQAQTQYIQTINQWNVARLDQAAAAGTLPQFIQSVN
jgi:outer membrane protein TolC